MAFGKRRQPQQEKQKEPSKKKKLAKLGKRGPGASDDGTSEEAQEKRPCKAGSSCAYPSAMEACRFRTEAAAASSSSSSRSSTWDCRSSLYDSFELGSFSNKLGRSLAQERLRPADAALPYSWRAPTGRRASLAPAHWPPRSRRTRAANVCCLPSCCFPKRTPTIHLGKRKGPSLQAAVHVIAKLARRGCHVIAAIPTCHARRVSQTHHHYHHHVHQLTTTLERPIQDHYGNAYSPQELDKGYALHNPKAPTPLVSCLEEPTCSLSSHSLAYLPLQEMDHHITSITYQP